MRKLILGLLAAIFLACTAGAAEVTERETEILGVETLEEGLDEETREQLGDVTPTGKKDFASVLLRLIGNAVTGSESALRASVRSGALMIGAAILCAFAGQFGGSGSDRAAMLAGTLAITAVCTGDLQTMMGLAGQTLEKLGTFTTLLMPVMASSLAASGGVAAGSALYAGSMLFFNVLTAAIRTVLQPLVLAGTALSAAECAIPEGNLDRMRELVFRASGVVLKGIMYLFTTYLALTGLLSSAADAMTLKAAKAALSGVLPVVGGIVSDASETVLASAGAIKAGVGVFGLLAMLAICLLPFFKIGISYLTLKITAAVSAVACLPAHTKLLGNLSTAMGLMLAMVGCEGLMSMIAVSCFLKVSPG